MGKYHHPWWGSYDTLNIAFSRDKSLRQRSTSGGVITSILISALERGLVDAAIVVGMSETEPWKYQVKIAQTKEEIIAAMGSKYAFIPFADFYEKIKNDSRRLAFVGLPCHVQVLRNMQASGKCENVKLILGVFCGYNIPFAATEFLIQKLNLKPTDIKSLKYRGGPYPGGFLVETHHHKTKFLPKYYYDFVDLMFVPDSCLRCKDYTSEAADISIGDGWGWGKSAVVIVRNKLGEEALNNPLINRVFISKEQFLEMHQHNLKHKKVGDSSIRVLIRKLLKKYGKFVPLSVLGFLARIRRLGDGGKFKMKWWSLEDVGKHWDETEDYDDINKNTYSYFRRFTDSLAMSSVKDGDLLLDVCCRTGNGAKYYSEHRKIKAVCMDVSNKMLKICAENMSSVDSSGNKPDFTLKYFDSYPLPAENEAFDVVLSLETLEHMPNPANFVEELHRVLKPDGELILSTPNIIWEPVHWFAAVTHIHHGEGPHKFLRRKHVIKYLKNAGFKIKKERTTVFIPFGPKFLTNFGDKIEKAMGERLRRILCLRRIFICEK